MNRKLPSPAARRATLALSLSLLSAGAAQAGFTSIAAPSGPYDTYFVTSTASAGAPGAGQNAQVDCNAGAFGGLVSDLKGCGITGGRPAGTSIEVGVADNAGRSKAVSALAQANDFHAVYDANNQVSYVVDPSFSRASAAADLRTASVHVSVFNNPYSGGHVAGSAVATLHDIVNFHVAGADANTSTRVQFQFSIDGTVVNDGRTSSSGEPGTGSLVSYFSLDNRYGGTFNSPEYSMLVGATWEIYRGVLTLPATTMVDDRGSQVQGSWTTVSEQRMVFDGSFDIIGADAQINPTILVALDCSLGLQCDYGNTAKLQFINLPGSVSFSSDSGVFLAPVPEPGSTALMLAGLAGIGAWLRRRRA
jgi:hypothetical protein